LLDSAEEAQIMGMPAPRPVTTIEELLALPEDGFRHELLNGEHVVTPAPTKLHQRVLAEFYVGLHTALRGRGDIEVLFSPADIHLGPKTLVQPDLFIVVRDNRSWADTPAPMLAVEILSPSTAARDRGKKRRLYLEAGVEEYWVVDIDASLVERWRQGDDRPEIVDGMLTWSLSVGASGEIDLLALFDRLHA
jgi:Uma2 family endonuclease